MSDITNIVKFAELENPIGKKFQYAAGPNQGKTAAVVKPWDDEDSLWAEFEGGARVPLASDNLLIILESLTVG